VREGIAVVQDEHARRAPSDGRGNTIRRRRA
jgi:hypothetical protein